MSAAPAARRPPHRALAVLVVLLGVLLPAAAASARDGSVTSFDGTPISYSFFPAPGLAAGQTAPTVLNGPGYSSGRAGANDGTVTALLAAGYNVVTFDPRGFGTSGGTVQLDSPDFEGRDAQALIDMVAREPEARIDAPGDPRVGFIGASYGGGIQNSTAAIDRRVDVITPQIAWHSLVTSLDKSATAKGGWGSLLFGIGTEGSTLPGLAAGRFPSPFGGRQYPAIAKSLLDGAATGSFGADDEAFFASRGPGDRIGRVTIPTLISQGTNDTLFTLHEAIENYRAQRAAGAPVSMIWFCGGLTDPSIAHGICFDSKGPDPAIVLHASLRWLDHYLKGDASVDVGPGFRWVADTGTLHAAASYPPRAGTPLRGTGSGTLPLVPGSTSGLLIAATAAPNGVRVALERPAAGTQLLGEPTLSLTYSGTALSPDGRIYAQLISDRTGRPLGNQVTPVPVRLDGATHTTSIPLEAVAADAGPGATYTLQLTDGTDVYFAARQPGLVRFADIRIDVPTVAPGASEVLQPATPADAGTPGAPAATTPTSPATATAASATGTTSTSAAAAAAGTTRCADPAPRSTLARRGAVLREGRLRLRGTAADAGCRAGLARVTVSVARKSGTRCRFLRADGRLARTATSCLRTRYLPARGRAAWSFTAPRRLPAGRYLVWSRAVDTGRNVERKARSRKGRLVTLR